MTMAPLGGQIFFLVDKAGDHLESANIQLLSQAEVIMPFSSSLLTIAKTLLLDSLLLDLQEIKK